MIRGRLPVTLPIALMRKNDGSKSAALRLSAASQIFGQGAWSGRTIASLPPARPRVRSASAQRARRVVTVAGAAVRYGRAHGAGVYAARQAPGSKSATRCGFAPAGGTG